MKKFLIITILFLCIGNNVFAGKICMLTDIDNSWAKEYIERLAEDLVVIGYSDNTFKPEDNVKINEFIKMLLYASDRKVTIQTGDWERTVIETAKYYGWIEEYENYSAELTRNEMARIIAKYIDVSKINIEKNKYIDLQTEYKKDILKLSKLGIINGYEDGTFRGDNTITRAEASAIICRSIDARLKIVLNKRHILNSKMDMLTNINKDTKRITNFNNRYEIKNNKVYIHDMGRYAELQGYNLREDNVTNKTIIDIIQSLITEEFYTGLIYYPSENYPNQIAIMFGKNEKRVYRNEYMFSYYFFENGTVKISDFCGNKEFNKDCFMKIKTAKLWYGNLDFERGEIIDDDIYKKMQDSLTAMFNKEISIQISEYIKEKTIYRYSNNFCKILEEKIFGPYTVYVYAKAGERMEIYIAK